VEERGPGIEVAVRVRDERLQLLLRVVAWQLLEPPVPPPRPSPHAATCSERRGRWWRRTSVTICLDAGMGSFASIPERL